MDLQAKEIHTVQFLWSLHPVDIVYLAFLTTIEVLIIRQVLVYTELMYQNTLIQSNSSR